MGVRFYDEALLNKVKKWVKDPQMTILGVKQSTRMFQMMADKSGDKVAKFPLITITRNMDVDIENISNRPLAFDASYVMNGENKVMQLNAIPIKINYQINIYTRYYEEADEYLRNFIFNFINYPSLEVTIPYNDLNMVHKSKVSVVPKVADTSDIPQRIVEGQFSRWTLEVLVDDAYLFDTPISDKWRFNGASIDVVEQDGSTTTE